ncbi:MAG: L-rhamnose mutarotase [Bacteroidota bacterium]
MPTTYYLACDLKDDPKLIGEYEAWHKAERVWPAVEDRIREAGVLEMQIFRAGKRLFMVMVVSDEFSFAHKAKMDASNRKVQEWEALMDQYQQGLPFAAQGEKWVLLKQIFQFNA